MVTNILITGDYSELPVKLQYALEEKLTDSRVANKCLTIVQIQSNCVWVPLILIHEYSDLFVLIPSFKFLSHEMAHLPKQRLEFESSRKKKKP